MKVHLPPLCLAFFPLLIAVACSGDEPKPAAPAEREITMQPPAESPPATDAPSKGAPSKNAPGEGGAARIEIESLTAAVPSEWRRVQPSSAMRKAEFHLPGAGGAGDASLTVFSFGSQAGSIEANLDRWKGQVKQEPAGNATVTKVERSEGKPITLLDVRGTYSPGMGDTSSAAGTRMMAAVVEASDATYYFKLVGPIATVDAWDDQYQAMLTSIRDAN